MISTPQARQALLGDNAAAWLATALDCVEQEYPYAPLFMGIGPDSAQTHRILHPAFYGSFDWHSCVEMHWVAVRMMRLVPGLPDEQRARAVLDHHLTAENLAVECAFFAANHHRGLERPYGWAWLLTLHAELDAWNDPDAQRWAPATAPLALLFADRLVQWLPLLTHPQRFGMHANTAFSLLRCLDYATLLSNRGQPETLQTVSASARRFFGNDRDCPASWEPSAAEFLSPALSEAELMGRILEPTEWTTWLDLFMPGLAVGEPANLMVPVEVTDATDGQLAHFAGLNLSRASSYIHIADMLPADDARRPVVLASADRHASASLDAVTSSGSDYMVTHWLAAYATLLLS